MIVELLGVPGSGKTTLVKHLADSTPARHGDLGSGDERTLSGRILGPCSKRIQWAVATLLAPQTAIRLLPTLSSREQLRMALELVRRDRELRRWEGGPGILLVDEGPRHRLALVTATMSTVNVATQVSTRIFRPDVAVVLQADPEVALDRVRSRATVNRLLDGLSDEGALSLLAGYERQALAVVNAAPVRLIGDAAAVESRLTSLIAG